MFDQLSSEVVRKLSLVLEAMKNLARYILIHVTLIGQIIKFHRLKRLRKCQCLQIILMVLEITK